MAENHELGRWGEQVAMEYLVTRRWRVLDRNYRDGPRELDLVVARGTLVAFVEVKTRLGEGALESITRRKRSDLARAAARWIRESDPAERGRRSDYRFDVVVVRPWPGREPQVQHLEDAWRPS